MTARRRLALLLGALAVVLAPAAAGVGAALALEPAIEVLEDVATG